MIDPVFESRTSMGSGNCWQRRALDKRSILLRFSLLVQSTDFQTWWSRLLGGLSVRVFEEGRCSQVSKGRQSSWWSRGHDSPHLSVAGLAEESLQHRVETIVANLATFVMIESLTSPWTGIDCQHVEQRTRQRNSQSHHTFSTRKRGFATVNEVHDMFSVRSQKGRCSGFHSLTATPSRAPHRSAPRLSFASVASLFWPTADSPRRHAHRTTISFLYFTSFQCRHALLLGQVTPNNIASGLRLRTSIVGLKKGVQHNEMDRVVVGPNLFLCHVKGRNVIELTLRFWSSESRFQSLDFRL